MQTKTCTQSNIHFTNTQLNKRTHREHVGIVPDGYRRNRRMRAVFSVNEAKLGPDSMSTFIQIWLWFHFLSEYWKQSWILALAHTASSPKENEWTTAFLSCFKAATPSPTWAEGPLNKLGPGWGPLCVCRGCKRALRPGDREQGEKDG